MDNDISNCFKSMSINNKQCIICNNIFTAPYFYDNNDVLCIICSNNYNELMLEDNYDNIEII